MSEQTGLVFACVLDGRGGARPIDDWAGVRAWSPGDGVMWLHLDYAIEDAASWLAKESGLDEVTLEALLAEAPRPRGVASGDGLIKILRSINLNRGAEPEDMVSIRLWIDSTRVISLRHRKVNAAKVVRESLGAGCGPTGPAELLVDLTDRILDRVARVVARLDDEVHALEDQVLSVHSHELRKELARLRRQSIALRRYIAPQRDVLAQLHSERVSWLRDVDRAQLREAADRLTRIVEDLDAARDRSAITQEELSSRLSELTNKRLYVLSLVAAVFLPLGLITSLWGVNLGGIPGQAAQWGFWVMAGALVAVSVGQLWLFRKLGWL